MENTEISLCSTFSGESHYMQRQAGNHRSVVNIRCTYLEKRKTRREKKNGEKFPRVLGNLQVVFVPYVIFPLFLHPLHFSGKSLMVISISIRDHVNTMEQARLNLGRQWGITRSTPSYLPLPVSLVGDLREYLLLLFIPQNGEARTTGQCYLAWRHTCSLSASSQSCSSLHVTPFFQPLPPRPTLA